MAIYAKHGYHVSAKNSLDGVDRIVIHPRDYVLNQMATVNLLNVFSVFLGYGPAGADVFEMLDDFLRFKDNEDFWTDILFDNFHAANVDTRGKKGDIHEQ